MTECFILELYIGRRVVWTDVVASAKDIATATRGRVWTKCTVFHWQRIGGIANSAKCGWVLKEEFPWNLASANALRP